MGAPVELRFADFEVSLRSGELRRNGVKIKLQEQPFQILVLLLEQRGEVVSRDELRQKLWTVDTFVDFDNGLNIAIKKLRTALGDDPDVPRYIETLPRRGYRFVAPVTAYEFRGEGSGDVFDAILPAAATTPEVTRPGVQSKPSSDLRSEPTLVKEEVSAAALMKTSLVPIVEEGRPTAKLIGVAAIIVTFAAAAAFGGYKLLTRTPMPDTHNMTVRQLTDDGTASAGIAAISSDGRLLAYVRREGEERSLHVQQVATGSEVTVVPARDGFFGGGATFTLDGNHLYYTYRDSTTANVTNLYSVPSLGGTPRQIVSDVFSAVTFSPDGKRMAYLRILRREREEQLIVANVDGSGEQVILRREAQSLGPMNNPSWSASNNLIALGTLEEAKTASIAVLTPEGKLVKAFHLPLSVGDVAWAPDLSGLFFTGEGKSTGMHAQIYFQPYPTGPPFKISNDLDFYSNVSVTADGESLVTAQIHRAATIYVADSPATLNDKIDWRLAPISNQQATGYNISWTPGGKLLQQDETYHVYETAADGTGRVDLLGSDEIALGPTSCGSDDVVVLTRILDNHRASVWRLNVVTGELKRLTFGRADQFPSCTPDGQWVVYQGLLASDSVGHILKVSVDGGAPVELARGDVFNPAVSPDGKLVVYTRGDGQGGSKTHKWVVQKLEGGPLVSDPVAATNNEEGWETDQGWKTLGWTPDGRAFTYVGNTTGSTQNVYMQPLDGSPAVQLTHFNSEPACVVGYGWSRDGKKFAVTRYRNNNSDVVMFSNFR